MAVKDAIWSKMEEADPPEKVPANKQNYFAARDKKGGGTPGRNSNRGRGGRGGGRQGNSKFK
jgi:hypothetical protein